MGKTALITGASVGIGYELSKVFAKNGYNLVLVSRNLEKMKIVSNEIIKLHDIQIKLIIIDLCRQSAPQELYDEITRENIKIDVLVNNAGIGVYGKYTESSIEKQMDLLQLNIVTPTMLCRLFGSDMAKRGSGRILNVSSTAAFQAGPLLSTYYASKGYLVLFTEALKNELRENGVTVTVLCPGPTKTEFFKRNDMIGTKLDRSPYIMSAAEVAEIGFSGLLKGKNIVIPGVVNNLLAFSVKLSPRRLPTKIAYFLNKKKVGKGIS